MSRRALRFTLGLASTTVLAAAVGCSAPSEPTAFFEGDHVAVLTAAIEGFATLDGAAEDRTWNHAESPEALHRVIVVNFKAPRDQAKELADALRTEILHLAAAGGAKVKDPDTDQVARKGAVDSFVWEYESADGRSGRIQFTVDAGTMQLTNEPDYKGGWETTPSDDAEAHSIDLAIDEFPPT
jgi:hypothetical protein